MGLSFPIKINKVNNLTDARYCAGMGVDVIGLSNEITSEQLFAISNWITGIDICLEIYDEEIDLEDYLSVSGLKYIETSNFKMKVPPGDIQIIWRLKNKSLNEIQSIIETNYHNFNYIHLIDCDIPLEELKSLSSKFPLIFSESLQTQKRIESIFSATDIKYIGLFAGDEIAPGLKDFEALSEILESLEIED